MDKDLFANEKPPFLNFILNNLRLSVDCKYIPFFKVILVSRWGAIGLLGNKYFRLSSLF